jgi:hypothetical protein
MITYSYIGRVLYVYDCDLPNISIVTVCGWLAAGARREAGTWRRCGRYYYCHYHHHHHYHDYYHDCYHDECRIAVPGVGMCAAGDGSPLTTPLTTPLITPLTTSLNTGQTGGLARLTAVAWGAAAAAAAGAVLSLWIGLYRIRIPL